MINNTMSARRLIRLPSTRKLGRSNGTDRGARSDSRTASAIATPQRTARRQPSTSPRNRPATRANATSPMIVHGRWLSLGNTPSSSPRKATMPNGTATNQPDSQATRG
jgi:hypothetical protein